MRGLLNGHKARRVLFAGLCYLPAIVWAQEGFTIRSVETHLVDKVYQLDASIDYRLPARVIEALQNGIPLVIVVELKVEKERKWWLNQTVASLQQVNMLIYHALSEKYILNRINSGVQEDYSRLEDALASLSRIDDLPLLDAKLAEPSSRYHIEIRTYLDIESLPAPVRPLAYLSPHWRLESEWYSWPLQR